MHNVGLARRTPAFRMARQSSLTAASPVGKLPRVLMTLMTLRNDRCRLPTALGTGMKISVPRFGRGRRDRGVW
jgi:hypothetical protein